MLEVCHLCYVPDPFNQGSQRFHLLDKSGIRIVSAKEVSEAALPIVCIEQEILIDQLRVLGVSIPRTLIDLKLAKKLSVGLSKKDGGEKHWNVWRLLKSHADRKVDIETFKKYFDSQIYSSESSDLSGEIESFLGALRSAWIETIDHLEAEGELDRLAKIEMPVQNIFNKRQHFGIKVDLDDLDEKFLNLRNEKYKAYIYVAKRLEINPSGLTFRNVQEQLEGTQLSHLLNHSDVSRFEQNLKIASESSDLAHNLLVLLRSDRDLRTLSLLSDSSGRSYPAYTSIGTVTGRIMVTRPYIQGLSRRYRSMLVPDNGREFAYLDYDQFEPGILASLSGDQHLKDVYQRDDMYEELAQSVFGNASKRDLAKLLFISFLYGMSDARMAEIAVAKDGDVAELREEALKRIQSFFAQFESALEYRDQVRRELLSDGRISTQLGGHRKRTTVSRHLSSSEQRWALSQRIQGTGSLILKEAVIQICQHFGPRSLVLPMHDALLLEFEAERSAEGIEIARSCMAAAMKKYCPDLIPKVSIEDFSS